MERPWTMMNVKVIPQRPRFKNASVAQLVEQKPEELCVGGSIPSCGTIF